MKLPMKCYWTSQSELVDGAILLVVGVLMLVARRKETQMFLSILGILLGIAAILLPAYLIGTCAPPMLCNTVMKTSLLILGPLVIIDSIVGLIISIKTRENE
jgi:uncharacterized membrane protein HdeD (DUF308 family)